MVRSFVIETFDAVNTNHVVIGRDHTALQEDLKAWGAKLAMQDLDSEEQDAIKDFVNG